MARIYPVPGSNAERILHLIMEKPGLSATAIIGAVGMNPSPARACIKALEEHGLIEDRPDTNGHHHYSAKVSVV